MNSSLIQLLVLAGIAVFLILKLKSVLGTREGFEKPPVPLDIESRPGPVADVADGKDLDITDHVAEGTPAALALAEMKKADPTFNVGQFLQGARGAYEMILMAYEKGEIEKVRPFIAADVYDAFESAIRAREDHGLTVEANFIGIRELGLQSASFDQETRRGEVSVRFTGELTQVVRNKAGEIIEGSPTEVKRQRDIWTFARNMGADDRTGNWLKPRADACLAAHSFRGGRCHDGRAVIGATSIL
jgi:hypothetical protein